MISGRQFPGEGGVQWEGIRGGCFIFNIIFPGQCESGIVILLYNALFRPLHYLYTNIRTLLHTSWLCQPDLQTTNSQCSKTLVKIPWITRQAPIKDPPLTLHLTGFAQSKTHLICLFIFHMWCRISSDKDSNYHIRYIHNKSYYQCEMHLKVNRECDVLYAFILEQKGSKTINLSIVLEWMCHKQHLGIDVSIYYCTSK